MLDRQKKHNNKASTKQIDNFKDEVIKDVVELKEIDHETDIKFEQGTVLFEFNKNIKLGGQHISKNEIVEICSQDALILSLGEHGSIVEGE